MKEIVAKNSERAGMARVCPARATLRGQPGAGRACWIFHTAHALRGETPVTRGGALVEWMRKRVGEQPDWGYRLVCGGMPAIRVGT